MKSSVQIDEALARELESAAKSRGVSMTEFVRQTLRQAASAPVTVARAPYVHKTHDFGAHVEGLWTALAEVESEEYLRRSRK